MIDSHKTEMGRQWIQKLEEITRISKELINSMRSEGLSSTPDYVVVEIVDRAQALKAHVLAGLLQM